MSTVSFAKMGLKSKEETIIFKLDEENKFEITTYLPISDKYDIAEAVIEKSTVDGFCHPVLKELWYSLYMVFAYTNISFTDKQKENYFKLYDVLETNGIFEAVFRNVPKTEIEQITSYIDDLEAKRDKFNGSAMGIVKGIMSEVLVNAESLGELVNGFDPEKYSEVVNFAKSIGAR